MRECLIKVEPFEFLNYTEIDIKKEINHHATAKVCGIIASHNEEEYLYKNPIGSNAKIIALGSNQKKKVLLNGLIQQINFRHKNGICHMELFIISSTILMDNDLHIRTFQDASMTYEDITSCIENENMNILHSSLGIQKTNKMFVQYLETDWAFCKRLASQVNSVIVADELSATPQVYFGVNSPHDTFEFNSDEYVITRNMQKYDSFKTIVSGYSEQDATHYEMASREIYYLCDKTNFHGTELIVYSIHTQLIGAQLKHIYGLRSSKGICTKKYYNKNLTGASLVGKVKDIQCDKIKISFFNDISQKEYKWFPYATVYSSPDNTGWYFMPEIGDEVRLSFPNEQENNAYAISCVHDTNRDNENIKSIRTSHGKAVVFAPDSLYITNGNGSSLLMDDHDGITLSSTKQIELNADENLTIQTQGTLDISGDNGVILQQTSGQISVNQNIDLYANHVRIR